MSIKVMPNFGSSATESNFTDPIINSIIVDKVNKLAINLFDNIGYFYLHINSEYYFVIAKHDYQKINSIKILSFQDACKEYKDCLREPKEFVQDISSYQKIEIETKKEEVQLEIETNECRRRPEYICPKYIKVENTRFYFSREYKIGLSGARGKDHRVDLDILHVALERKIKQLKKIKITEECSRSYYFKVDKQILNVVVGVKPPEEIPGKRIFIIITAYFPKCNAIQSRLKFSREQFKCWFENLKALNH